MTVWYLDSSACVKRYYLEAGSSRVEALFASGDQLTVPAWVWSKSQPL